MKYNYALEDDVQNFTCFEAYIQIQEEGKYLQIVNRKPVENTEYILEADQSIVKAVKDAKQVELKQLDENKKKYTNEQMDEDPEFNPTTASASTYIRDIIQI